MLKKITLLALVFLVLISCSKDDKITLVSSTGRINHVLIVIKNSDWQGEVGDALREIIAQPMVGLPQEEPQFSITQVPPKTFNNLFKRTRNILFIGYGKKENFYTNKNIYASPQITLTILSDNKEALIENINTHKKEIISTFKKNDLALYQNRLKRESYNRKTFTTFNNLNFSLRIPSSYKQVEDDGDFLWFRNSFTKGFLNIIAYEIPKPSNNTFDLDYILKYRDSIGKKYIPGQFENTYMKTEPQFTPITKEVKLAGKSALESRGLWLVEGDFMGGPFISYAIDDIKNNRLLIIEGFSYSPSAKKRDIVFEMEAILKTIKLK
ncbi:MAG: DUF4837 family protein [Flavobacteriaceae bacterium]|nr:DUF4837 family protein [Flavobacteriaceae bacterium]